MDTQAQGGKEIKTVDAQVREGAAYGALSYVLFLWLIPFLVKKDNDFAHYHARQGLVLFISEGLFFFLSMIPVVGGIFWLAGMILFLWASLYGIFSALTGKKCVIPLVTDIALKLVV